MFLHETSVADDPTRVFRGARYGARLGFQLAPSALVQVQATLVQWPWAWKPGDVMDAVPPALGTRLRMELELLFEREPWQKHSRCCSNGPQCPCLILPCNAIVVSADGWFREVRLELPALMVLVAAAGDPVCLSRLQLPPPTAALA